MTETSDVRTAEAPAAIRWLAWLVAAACVGFAAVNVVMELSGQFDHGPLAEYAVGLTVMDWLVVGLKLLGGAAALLTVTERPARITVRVRAVLVWGAFGLLALYSAGNLVELVYLLVAEPDRITAPALAYVACFAAAAVGYGALAVSYQHRCRPSRRWAVVGILGAPLLLGLLLGAIPAALAAFDLLPA